MSKSTKKIEGTSEAWESGELGEDEKYVVRSKLDEKLIDDALELQMISIRLQKSLIEDFKLIARFHGVGYQPLIRQMLKRFADSEMKRLYRECASQSEEDLKKLLLENACDKADPKNKACG